ncbi:MAG: hypothetical protein H5U19_14880 [Rhodobacteraceae bacterium]|nr:hypothetical protein [Paracoccaceae bacterium]
MTDHNAYADQMKAKIDEWAAEIDKLQAKSAEVQVGAKAEYDKQIAALKTRQAEAEANWKKMQTASAASWADMRAAFETSYKAFADAASSAVKRF